MIYLGECVDPKTSAPILNLLNWLTFGKITIKSSDEVWIFDTVAKVQGGIKSIGHLNAVMYAGRNLKLLESSNSSNSKPSNAKKFLSENWKHLNHMI